MPNEFYIDGDLDVARASGLPVFSAPFEAVNINYVLRQEFIQSKSAFTPLAFNTPHPDHPTYMLVNESEKQDIGGGLVRWTRTYAQKPAAFSEPGGNYSYNFIGFLEPGSGASTTVITRERFTRNVPAIIRRDFFVVPTDYPDFEDIPILTAQRYYRAVSLPLNDDDYIADAGAWTTGPTVPSFSQYEAMIAANVELVVEDSTISRWMGNIYVRETRSVLAQ